MMAGGSIELHVVSYAGAELSAGDVLRVGGSPSSIGRSPACHLCLEDSERLISRSHLAVWLDASGHIHLKNTSATTPAFVDGRDLAPGASCTVVVGQNIVVGRYLLAARAIADVRPPSAHANSTHQAASEAPFVPIPAEFDVFARPLEDSHRSSSGGTAQHCSLDDFSGSGETSAELFAELPAFDARGPTAPLSGLAEQGGLTPANPIADLLGVNATPAGLIDSCARPAGSELEGLFVLPAGVISADPKPPDSKQPDPKQHDRKLPDLKPSEPIAADASAAVQGPGLVSVLIAASSVSAEAGASTLDGLIGDGGALDVLALLGHPAGPEPSASPRGPAGLGAELMKPESRHRVLAASSFGSGAADAVANTRPEPAQPQPQPQPQPLPQRGAAAVLEQSGAAVDRARQLAAGSDATDDGANAAVRLQRAFARGCGVPAERISDFDEQAVEDIGQLMAALVSGALQMVHARSSTKHEMRANVTIIASSGNNPLKFAPDATAALMQLLGRGLPGFMAPQEAVIDAFEDLCAHQVGLLSASRSAMYAVAARLSPDRLQEAAGGPRGFSGLLPSAHKARLWDCYLKSHADLLGEAREEFDAVFQSAFVRAYEGEVQRLQAGASS